MGIVPFYKMEASGNDFVVIDNRRRAIKDPAAFARQTCALHSGIGADGLLLVESSAKAAFKMRIINRDGSEAESCGNGFRCIARFAREKLRLSSRFTFESLAGIIQSDIRDKRIRVQLVKPKDLRMNAELSVQGNRLHYSFVNTGVPHAVIFVEGLDKIDVNRLGKAVRDHRAFAPKGTNVNFVQIQNEKEIRVRTYERGVESETLACGTGSTASAVIAALAGYVRPPVRVYTRGGEVLVIDFKTSGELPQDVFLEGEARFVFEGRLYV